MSPLSHYSAVLAFCLVFCSTNAQLPNFTNPILDTDANHPSVLKLSGWYYLAITNEAQTLIEILKSRFLTSFRHAEKSVVYKAPAGYSGVHSPRLYELDGELFLNFPMTNSTNRNSLYLITAVECDNPMGKWTTAIRPLDNIWPHSSFHGSVLIHNRRNYFVWASVHPTTGENSIYISPMASATDITGPVTLLRQPTEDWECHDVCSTMAPSFIYNRGVSYMVFTAGLAASPDCSLGYMSIESGKDPLETSNWVLPTGPVFSRNDGEDVYVSCMSTFTTSPDGTETWMVYHGSDNATNVSGNRLARIEKIEWDKENGSPKFPTAHGYNSPQQRPSGEPKMFVNPIIDVNCPNPTIFRVGNFYYFVNDNNLTHLEMYKSSKLSDLRNAEVKVIYIPPEGYSRLHTPRLNEIDDELYLYFVMAQTNQTRRAFVIKAENSQDPMGNWSMATRISENLWDTDTFDGTTLQQNNKLYFVWSASGIITANESIYIAPMKSPFEVVEPVVLLREPTESFEYHDEAPAFFFNGGKTFMTFTGIFGDEPTFGISYMTIDTDKDPLDIPNWSAAIGPVVTSNEDENITAALHAWFTTSPDGTETWMLYGGVDPLNPNRTARLERIEWNTTDRSPVFPKPHGRNHPQPVPREIETFQNPVLDTGSSDTSVLRVEAFYYLVKPDKQNTELVILKSGTLTDFRTAEMIIAYREPSGYTDLQAAQMHEIEGELYIYFTMRNSSNVLNIYFIRADNPEEPMGKWGPAVKPLDGIWSSASNHGTILRHNGLLYFLFTSPHPTSGHQSIYISEMENATLVKAPVTLLRDPREEWECSGSCTSSSPFFIYNEDHAYLVYTFGDECTDGQGLTWMSIETEKNPLDGINWIQAPGLVFGNNVEENVYCTGHASFTFSPANQETWMLYHGSASPNSTDRMINTRIERITWNEDKTPKFPRAHGIDNLHVAPTRIRWS